MAISNRLITNSSFDRKRGRFSEIVVVCAASYGGKSFKMALECNPLSTQAERLKSLVREWIPKRKNTVHTLRVLADELLTHHDNVCIAQVAGSSTSIAALGVMAVGFGLSFVTGGASLIVASTIVSGVGGGLGAAGGLVIAGSAIAKFFIQRDKFSTAKKIIDEDQEATAAIKDLWEQVEKEAQKEQSKHSLKATFGAAGLLRTTAMTGFKVGARTAAKAGSEGGEALFRGLGKVSKVAHIGGFAMSAFMLPFDIYSLVTNAKEVHAARKSKTGSERAVPELVQKLREMADELEKKTPDENEFTREVNKFVSLAEGNDSGNN